MPARIQGNLVMIGERIVGQLAPSPEPTFAEAMDGIYRERYTGPVVLHCLNGIPQMVERPNPQFIKLRRT